MTYIGYKHFLNLLEATQNNRMKLRQPMLTAVEQCLHVYTTMVTCLPQFHTIVLCALKQIWKAFIRKDLTMDFSYRPVS